MAIRKNTIALLAGDGIGPEVMLQTIRVLNTIGCFNYKTALIGGAAYIHTGSHCPDETLKICEEADAILFGSVGGPVEQQHLPQWHNCEANSILKLRKYFNFNINMRPIQTYPEITKNNINFIIFRELTGGLYFGAHKKYHENNQKIALDECIYTEQQITEIAHAAFKTARIRHKKICSVDKANVLATSKLWREVVTEISKKYSDVNLTHMLVDNCAMQIILNPDQFDVILTENMFGDILSDLAACLPGSLGLVPSASFNNKKQALYEPSGGSAPAIAGLNVANPTAQILSAAMMLRYSFNMAKEAGQIEAAIKNTLKHNIFTRDIAKNDVASVSTQAFTDTVIAQLL